MCAIHNCKSLDTSMRLTPVSGLPGATRSGSIDPTLIFHYTHSAAKISHDESLVTPVGITEAEYILNKKSGWQALAGTSDFGEIIQKKDSDEGARVAYDLLVDRILDVVGAYWLKLGGKVDALVFSGGIGEKGKELRGTVIERCACLGFVTDRPRNEAVDDQEGEVVEIGKDDQRKVLVCRTDEQVCGALRKHRIRNILRCCSSRWQDSVPRSPSSGIDPPLWLGISPRSCSVWRLTARSSWSTVHARNRGDVPA